MPEFHESVLQPDGFSHELLALEAPLRQLFHLPCQDIAEETNASNGAERSPIQFAHSLTKSWLQKSTDLIDTDYAPHNLFLAHWEQASEVTR